jgi:hypothetical protein
LHASSKEGSDVGQPAQALAPDVLLLGRYRPLRPLGSGGSAAVWLARDEKRGREVTVKVVPLGGKAGPRARREAQAMAALDHPRCQRVYACGRDAESVYIAYEYVPGRTLRDAFRAGALTDDDALEAAAQVLDALAHAHARGIVHRDVKPANILLADERDARVSVRLLDFGLARVAEADTLTAAGDVPGTLAYIAPERLHGRPASAAGDVWSVGVVLYEALSGIHPFWRPALAESAEAIIRGARSLAELRPDLPARLLAAVDHALSLDPAHRPSAAKLAKRLRRARGRGGGVSVDAAERTAYRFAPAALAGVYAGAGASLLPFYPSQWSIPIAAAVAALSFARPRAGLVAMLAVPLLPLGNVALALALLYGVVALAWLALHAREPAHGMLAPLGVVPGLLPLAYRGVPSPLVRGLGAGAATLAGAAALALRDGAVGLNLEGSRAPLPAAHALAGAVQPGLALEAAGLAVAALLLPWAARRGRWGVAFWSAGTVALAVLPIPAVALVLAVWFTAGWLWSKS